MFWRFFYARSEWRGKNGKNCQIHICVFHCVVKHICTRILKICILFLVYSQNSLNLPRDDHNLFSTSSNERIITLVTNKKFLKIKSTFYVESSISSSKKQFQKVKCLPLQTFCFQITKLWYPQVSQIKKNLKLKSELSITLADVLGPRIPKTKPVHN